MATVFKAGSAGANTLDATPTATVTINGTTYSPAVFPSPNATPRCFVDIYPYEGGKYSFSDQDPTLLSVEVQDSVRGMGSGFSIVLGPGGPNGTSGRPSWADVLTQMSLVVIGMSRGAVGRIVMVGVVKTAIEDSKRRMDGAGRSIVISGTDFSEFFLARNFYNLVAQQGLSTVAIDDLGFLSYLDQGLVNGTPDSLGQSWFTTAMAGPNGILGKTQFNYAGSPISFHDIMSTVFEPFSTPVGIPQSAAFLGDGSFATKFGYFFQFPWYELFLTTAPVPTYKATAGQATKGYTAAPKAISMTGFADSSPTLVARVNPLPTLTASDSSSTPTYTLDRARWDALPVYSLNGWGERDFATTWDASEVRNFYIINPLSISRLNGSSNSSITPYAYSFVSWIDNSSIHRYGYRPEVTETHWFTDPTGIQAQQNAKAGYDEDHFQSLVSQLALKVCTYHQPTPFMARAQHVNELRPDILPGCRLAHAPYRDGVTWDFYIESVTHTYSHGGLATTSLTLTRGMPHTVYADNDLLTAVLLGNARRLNGSVTKGVTPGTGISLTPVNYSTVQALLADNATMFATPQANTAATNPLITNQKPGSS